MDTVLACGINVPSYFRLFQSNCNQPLVLTAYEMSSFRFHIRFADCQFLSSHKYLVHSHFFWLDCFLADWQFLPSHKHFVSSHVLWLDCFLSGIHDLVTDCIILIGFFALIWTCWASWQFLSFPYIGLIGLIFL